MVIYNFIIFAGQERKILMIKKISAAVMAFMLCVTALASCSDKDTSSASSADSSVSSSADASQAAGDDSAATADSSAGTEESAPDPSFTIDGKEIDTDGLIICTVDGTDVDFDTFRYYYYYTLNLYKQNYGADLETIASTDGGFDMLMEDVITQLKNEFVTYRLAKENGIELNDEDNKYVEDIITQSREGCSTEEEYKTQLKNSYLTEDVFKKMLELSRLYQNVEDKLLTNGGKYATSQEDFKKIVQDTDEYSRVVHILIPYECQTEITDEDTKDSYEDMTLSQKLSAKQAAFDELSEEDQAAAKDKAKKLAEDVLQKAKDGEDFDSLIKEYGWDPGMETSPDGYYVNKNTSFVDEFKTAAFELKENEISDLIESEMYGWFIIKRLPVDMDYVNENIENMIIEYDQPAIRQLYNDITEEMEVTYGEYYDKITADSIK